MFFAPIKVPAVASGAAGITIPDDPPRVSRVPQRAVVDVGARTGDAQEELRDVRWYALRVLFVRSFLSSSRALTRSFMPFLELNQAWAPHLAEKDERAKQQAKPGQRPRA